MLLTLLSLALAADPVAERAALLRNAAAVRPPSQYFRWQKIPWLTDAEEALTRAKEENRPLFVWMAGGRDRDGSPLERC